MEREVRTSPEGREVRFCPKGSEKLFTDFLGYSYLCSGTGRKSMVL